MPARVRRLNGIRKRDYERLCPHSALCTRRAGEKLSGWASVENQTDPVLSCTPCKLAPHPVAGGAHCRVGRGSAPGSGARSPNADVSLSFGSSVQIFGLSHLHRTPSARSLTVTPVAWLGNQISFLSPITHVLPGPSSTQKYNIGRLVCHVKIGFLDLLC